MASFEKFRDAMVFAIVLFLYILLNTLYDLFCSRDLSNDEWRQRVKRPVNQPRGIYYGSH